MPEYKEIEGQCGTCGSAAGFDYADSPSGPEDGVHCTSEGMARELESHGQGDFAEGLKTEGYLSLMRLEALAEETFRCQHWKPKKGEG